MNQRIARMIWMRILPQPDQMSQQGTVSDEFERRNFRLALINGVLTRIAFRFVYSSMVLAAFVKQLTGSNLMVGLVSSTMRAGSVWPQLFISNLLEHRPRKMPFYILGSSLRISSWIFIVILTLFIGNRNHLTLFLWFYVLYFTANSAMGVSIIPFSDIIAKSIPVQRRARLFGLRSFLGGIFSIGAGFTISFILSDRFYFSFPYNYACMFGICALMLTGSSVAFALSREPIHPVRDERRPLWEHLKRGPHFLKADRDYRYYIALRMVASFGIMCTSFYIPYALDRIGVPASAIGTYTAVAATSTVFSNLAWAYVGEKYGSRTLLIVTSCLACVAPLIAVSVRYVPENQQAWVYSLVFIVTQAFTAGRGIGYMTYSLNVAPSMSRPTYLGFLNTMMFPISFVPVLGGALLKVISYESVFILSASVSVLAVYFAVNLSNVDEQNDVNSKDD